MVRTCSFASVLSALHILIKFYVDSFCGWNHFHLVKRRRRSQRFFCRQLRLAVLCTRSFHFSISNSASISERGRACPALISSIPANNPVTSLDSVRSSSVFNIV